MTVENAFVTMASAEHPVLVDDTASIKDMSTFDKIQEKISLCAVIYCILNLSMYAYYALVQDMNVTFSLGVKQCLLYAGVLSFLNCQDWNRLSKGWTWAVIVGVVSVVTIALMTFFNDWEDMSTLANKIRERETQMLAAIQANKTWDEKVLDAVIGEWGHFQQGRRFSMVLKLGSLVAMFFVLGYFMIKAV